jgi:hypothetical protein
VAFLDHICRPDFAVAIDFGLHEKRRVNSMAIIELVQNEVYHVEELNKKDTG